MVCVREPSEGDEVDGPLVIVARFDMVVEDNGGVVFVGKRKPP